MKRQRMRMLEAAEALAAEVDKLLPRARAAAPLQADHLERSADSVLFNTAEGVGCFKPKMKIASYDIARREANEVRAILRRLVLKGVFIRAATRKAYNLASTCIRMLTSAIRTLESSIDL